MPSSRTLACAVSLSIAASWTTFAVAQSDGAPVPQQPEPPDAPLPSEPVPAPEPPAAAPAPREPAPSEPAPPPNEQPPTTPPAAPTPPPAAPPNTAPPSGAFPLPPTVPPASKHRPAPETAPSAREHEPTASEPRRPKSPSEGLFEEHRPADGARPPASDDKDEGTDQFKIGPVAGIGIPSVVSFGGTMKLTRFLGAGVNIGLIPKVRLSYYGDATLSYQHYDIYGRLYPFGGGFFLSGGAGYATVDGTLSSSKNVAATVLGNTFSGTVNYNSQGTVRTLMLTALIGYFYTTSIGFSFGVDAGAQIPIAPSQVSYSSAYHVSSTAPALPGTSAQQEAEKQAAPIVTAADKSVRDTLEKIGRTTLPTLNLRIGWIL